VAEPQRAAVVDTVVAWFDETLAAMYEVLGEQ
jgi:hypothetical protein